MLLTPFKTYPDMENFHLIQFIELRFQIDHMIAKKKYNFLVKYYTVPTHIILFTIMRKHRETKMFSDGNGITVIELIWNDDSYIERVNEQTLIKR